MLTFTAFGAGCLMRPLGAMVVALTEVMPVEVRVVGFSLACSLAAAGFGGFRPTVSTWLIEPTGDKGWPMHGMTVAAVCGLGATLRRYRRSAVPRRA